MSKVHSNSLLRLCLIKLTTYTQNEKLKTIYYLCTLQNKIQYSMKKVYLFLVIFVVVFGGCRPRYTTIKSKSQTTSTEHKSTTKDVVNQNSTIRVPIDYLNISDASIAYTTSEGKNYYMSMNLKVIRGKEISISVLPMLGIELFRIRFTPERFYIFDKFNRQYCDNSYQYLSKMVKAEVSYNMIEALLLNNLFSIDPQATVEKAYGLAQMKDRFVLSSLSDFGGYRHSFELSPDYMLTSTSVSKLVDEVLRLDYSSFKLVDKVIFPTTMEMKANLEQNGFNLKIDIKRVEINKVFTIPTVDFERYTRVECGSIM